MARQRGSGWKRRYSARLFWYFFGQCKKGHKRSKYYDFEGQPTPSALRSATPPSLGRGAPWYGIIFTSCFLLPTIILRQAQYDNMFVVRVKLDVSSGNWVLSASESPFTFFHLSCFLFPVSCIKKRAKRQETRVRTVFDASWYVVLFPKTLKSLSRIHFGMFRVKLDVSSGNWVLSASESPFTFLHLSCFLSPVSCIKNKSQETGLVSNASWYLVLLLASPPTQLSYKK